MDRNILKEALIGVNGRRDVNPAKRNVLLLQNEM